MHIAVTSCLHGISSASQKLVTTWIYVDYEFITKHTISYLKFHLTSPNGKQITIFSISLSSLFLGLGPLFQDTVLVFLLNQQTFLLIHPNIIIVDSSLNKSVVLLKAPLN